jgi:hypothetical protein
MTFSCQFLKQKVILISISTLVDRHTAESDLELALNEDA